MSESPNTTLDASVKKLLKDSEDKAVDELLLDRRRKAILAAISWEKVKNAILDKDDPFDSDSI